jgi:hypothetical protein
VISLATISSGEAQNTLRLDLPAMHLAALGESRQRIDLTEVGSVLVLASDSPIAAHG